MSIKLSEESYIGGPKEIKIPQGKGEITLYAHEIGYAKYNDIQAKKLLDKAGDFSPTAYLIVESIKDKDGNQFTPEEVGKLRRSVAEALLFAALDVNGFNQPEKDGEKTQKN